MERIIQEHYRRYTHDRFLKQLRFLEKTNNTIGYVSTTELYRDKAWFPTTTIKPGIPISYIIELCYVHEIKKQKIDSILGE